jgi:hypothetical protein
MNTPNTDSIQLTAYSLGYEKGERSCDVQNLWGGRITRKGEAEANARAFLKAREDGDELDWIADQPLPYDLETDTLEAVRSDFGGTAVLDWMKSENLTEEKAAEITAGEWMMGYTDGILDALEESAKMYLADPEA